MKERIALVRALFGGRAGDAVHLARLVHGYDAFTPASVVWMELTAAQRRTQADEWVSGQELVTGQPQCPDMVQRVVRTWWRANYVEARRGDDSGCTVDDSADVTEYSFRLAATSPSD
jgi:hypothetical protein